MACIDCGSTRTLRPLTDGREGSNCRRCRSGKTPKPRATLSDLIVPKSAPRFAKPIVRINERQAAIKRAQATARNLGIPLSQALEAEGI